MNDEARSDHPHLLPVCLQAGIYWVELIDHYCAGWGILFAAVLEIVGIVWIYGRWASGQDTNDWPRQTAPAETLRNSSYKTTPLLSLADKVVGNNSMLFWPFHRPALNHPNSDPCALSAD